MAEQIMQNFNQTWSSSTWHQQISEAIPTRNNEFIFGTGAESPEYFRKKFSGTNTIYILLTHVNESTSDPDNSTASRLAQIKQKFNLSISELARVFGVSRQAIYDWQDGKALSFENEKKLNNLTDAITILADPKIELSASLLRRDIEGIGSIMTLLTKNVNLFETTNRIKAILLSEAAQREKLARRFEGRASNQASVNDFGAAALQEGA